MFKESLVTKQRPGCWSLIISLVYADEFLMSWIIPVRQNCKRTINGKPWNLPPSFLLRITAGLFILSVIIAWEDVTRYECAEKYWADVSIDTHNKYSSWFCIHGTKIHLYRNSAGMRELLQSFLGACIQHSEVISHCSHWAPKGGFEGVIDSKIPTLILCIKQKMSTPKPETAAPENTAVFSEMRVIVGAVLLDWLYWPL